MGHCLPRSRPRGLKQVTIVITHLRMPDNLQGGPIWLSLFLPLAGSGAESGAAVWTPAQDVTAPCTMSDAIPNRMRGMSFCSSTGGGRGEGMIQSRRRFCPGRMQVRHQCVEFTYSS